MRRSTIGTIVPRRLMTPDEARRVGDGRHRVVAADLLDLQDVDGVLLRAQVKVSSSWARIFRTPGRQRFELPATW